MPFKTEAEQAANEMRDEEKPKTKRYFYSDPLAAAWMAKHHDMRFEITEPYYDLSDYSASDYSFNISERARDFFIHPDSLHLLEVLEGDFITFIESRYPELEPHANPQMVFLDNGSMRPPTLRVSWYRMGDTFLDVKNQNEIRDVRIIQRNDKSFMWPESEAL